MYIKKGDKVQVLSGKDRGKQGVVLRALPSENKVVVEGVSVVKKAVKPNAANQQGGIVSQEAAIDASNVNLVCPECGKVTRVGHEKDGKNKLRVCKKCGHKLGAVCLGFLLSPDVIVAFGFLGLIPDGRGRGDYCSLCPWHFGIN